jgi:hypothetical protein
LFEATSPMRREESFALRKTHLLNHRHASGYTHLIDPTFEAARFHSTRARHRGGEQEPGAKAPTTASSNVSLTPMASAGRRRAGPAGSRPASTCVIELTRPSAQPALSPGANSRLKFRTLSRKSLQTWA